jgi:hypothetical protein
MQNKILITQTIHDSQGYLLGEGGFILPVRFDLIETQDFHAEKAGYLFCYGNLRVAGKFPNRAIDQLMASSGLMLLGEGLKAKVHLQSRDAFTVVEMLSETDRSLIQPNFSAA